MFGGDLLEFKYIHVSFFSWRRICLVPRKSVLKYVQVQKELKKIYFVCFPTLLCQQKIGGKIVEGQKLIAETNYRILSHSLMGFNCHLITLINKTSDRPIRIPPTVTHGD